MLQQKLVAFVNILSVKTTEVLLVQVERTRKTRTFYIFDKVEAKKNLH